MGALDPKSIRNVALLSHGGCGKTTLAEACLVLGKVIPKAGSIEKGTTAMTTEPEEISRNCSITMHFGHFKWQNTEINLADTAGYFNFLEQTRGVIPGVDGAVVLISAVSGVKPEAERLWNMAKDMGVPVIGFLNKADHEKADLNKALSEATEILGMPAQPVTFPLKEGGELKGVIDLLSRKAFLVKDGKSTEGEIPDGMKEEVEKQRTALIERIAESDEALIDKYLEGEELSDEELSSGLKNAVADRGFLPVYSGSGLLNIGVSELLDGIAACVPDPVSRNESRPFAAVDASDPEKEVELACSESEPFAALVLKTTVDPFSGKISVVRVVSGSVKGHDAVMNTSNGKKQTVGHVYKLQGKELEDAEILSAGDIGVLSKLEETSTGDTLCSPDREVVLERVKFVEPSVSYAVSVEGNTAEKVNSGLGKIAAEDPTVRYTRDPDTGEFILAGMGQNHLEVVLEMLERKFGGKATLQKPKVAYRETIRRKVKAQGKLKKQTGGHGQFANCWIEVEPLPRDGGFEFEDLIVGGIIPKQYIPSVEKGVLESMKKGILGGYPVVDVRVKLVDGSFHNVDSSDYAFQVAGSLAFKSAEEQADPVLLEPIVEMSIIVPEENTGDIMKDISGRRGRVLGMETKGKKQEIKAEVPIAEVLEYGNVLNSMTAGQGLYTMAHSTYREVPANIAEKVLEEREKAASAG